MHSFIHSFLFCLDHRHVESQHYPELLEVLFYKTYENGCEFELGNDRTYFINDVDSINYLKDDEALEKFKKENKNKKFDISRFKGLGEMNAGELCETAMNPETRTLIQVSIADGKAAEAKAATMFEVLMGNDVAKRKTFIEQNAKDVRFLDV